MSTSNQIANFFAEFKTKAKSVCSCIRRNPLCGLNLGRGVKCIAVAKMIFATFVILGSISICLLLRRHNSPVDPASSNNTISEKNEDSVETIRHSETASVIAYSFCSIVLPILLIVSTTDLLLYGFLYQGVRTNNYKIVNQCWLIMVCFALLDLLATISVYIAGKETIGLELTEVIYDLVYLYTILVVYCYKEELNRGADLRGQTRPSGDSSGDFERFV